jgi:hypothetical protein
MNGIGKGLLSRCCMALALIGYYLHGAKERPVSDFLTVHHARAPGTSHKRI